MPARHKTALSLLEARFRKIRTNEPLAPNAEPERQELPPPPPHFDAIESAAWRDICSPVCERRLWSPALTLWAESFASLLAMSRISNDGNAKPNRAQLRLYANDLRQLIGDAPPPTERNPFDDI